MESRTTSWSDDIPRARPVLGWLVAAYAVVSQVVAVMISPPDRDMGNLQKIMYVHVPAAWISLIAVLVVLVASVLYLVKHDTRYDMIARAAAEVGVVFMGLTLVLGSIWGRPTWGTWWTWDARLTSMAILFLLFVGYLALRAAADDPVRRAQWGAMVGVLAGIDAYIVYMSVRWWRTLHQIQSSPATVDPNYVIGLRMNAFAFLFIFCYWVFVRYRTARLERAVEQQHEEQALREGVTAEGAR